MTSAYEKPKMMFAQNQAFKRLMGTIHFCYLILWGMKLLSFVWREKQLLSSCGLYN